AAEGDRAADLAGKLADRDRHVEVAELLHEGRVEVRDAARPQGHLAARPVADVDPERVVVEIEEHLERSLAIGDQGSRKTPGSDIEGDVPAMVEPRSLLQTNLSDDLRPQV